MISKSVLCSKVDYLTVMLGHEPGLLVQLRKLDLFERYRYLHLAPLMLFGKHTLYTYVESTKESNTIARDVTAISKIIKQMIQGKNKLFAKYYKKRLLAYSKMQI